MTGYFFDEPQTKADFDFWSTVPTWSLDEIVALSLGKDPRFVSSDKFGHGMRGNDFSAAFFGRLHQAERAKEAGILSDHTPATHAIKWADGAGFAFPKDVVKKVRRFARLTTMKTSITAAPVESNATDSEIKTELDSFARPSARPLPARNRELTQPISEHGSTPQAAKQLSRTAVPLQLSEHQPKKQSVEPTLATSAIELAVDEDPEKIPLTSQAKRQLANLRALLAAMAISKYNFNPEVKSEVPEILANLLDKKGVQLGAETIRIHLKAGSDLLLKGHPKK